MNKIIQKRDCKSDSGNVLTEYLIALGAIAIGLLMMMPSMESNLENLNSEQLETHSRNTSYPPALYNETQFVKNAGENDEGTEFEAP